MIRTLLGTALAAALLAPATALAAPHWSSPVKIAGPAADPPGISPPQAFVTARRALARRLLRRAAARPVGRHGRRCVRRAARARQRCDRYCGRRRRARRGRHARRRLDVGRQRPRRRCARGPARAAQSDLPGANVERHRRRRRARRHGDRRLPHKPAANSYQLVAATAAPGLRSARRRRFTPPRRASTASTPPQAPAEPSRSLTGAWRRATAPTRSCGRPAPPASARRRRSRPATPPDIQTQIAFEADGTIVAAWANYGGAAYALRAPGAAAFGDPAPLGPAGEATYLVDLAPTPQGGTAATWSAAGADQGRHQGPGRRLRRGAERPPDDLADRRAAGRSPRAGRAGRRSPSTIPTAAR